VAGYEHLDATGYEHLDAAGYEHLDDARLRSRSDLLRRNGEGDPVVHTASVICKAIQRIPVLAE